MQFELFVRLRLYELYISNTYVVSCVVRGIYARRSFQMFAALIYSNNARIEL